MLSVVMLSVVMLSVFVMNVVMLSVEAPIIRGKKLPCLGDVKSR
jgi:hypothetical protein